MVKVEAEVGVMLRVTVRVRTRFRVRIPIAVDESRFGLRLDIDFPLCNLRDRLRS